MMNNGARKMEKRREMDKKLIHVIKKGDYNNFLLLLRFKPDLNVFVDGQTVLHHCLLQRRDVRWCRQLIINGANPNLANKDGWHPIHLAAFYGLHESVAYLMHSNRQVFSEETDQSVST